MKILKLVGVVLGVLVLGAVGSLLYARHAAAQRLDRQYTVEVAALPIPFPLSPEEIAELAKTAEQKAEGLSESETTAELAGAEENAEGKLEAAPAVHAPADRDLEKIALERALARAERYLKSRAGCPDCHGEDFGGKVILDHPMLGRWVAPNITRGGVTKNYKPEDWVRIIRHGVKPNGKPATMPSVDTTWLSDQEISDIAAYIMNLPAIERELPASTFGPVFTFLYAFNDNQVSAEVIDHTAPRLKYPPSTSQASLELGKHIAATCVGCHRMNFAGGTIPGGAPSWPPAANLTFHETGLEKWSLRDFTRALREGKRPDGRELNPIMPIAYTKNLSDTEIESIYLYFQSLPKVPREP